MSKSIFSKLESALEELSVSKSDFSLGHTRDERTCLTYSEGKWLVYYSERGDLRELREFDAFDEAAKDFIDRLT